MPIPFNQNLVKSAGNLHQTAVRHPFLHACLGVEGDDRVISGSDDQGGYGDSLGIPLPSQDIYGALRGPWEWYTRWDYRYQSKQYQEMHNGLWTPSLAMIDGRIGTRNDNWDISLWVRNLTDSNTPLSAYAFQTDLNSSDFVTTVVNRERRRVGLTANFRY